MKDFVIYTAITKGYDKLNSPPASWRDEADLVAFLEQPQPTTGWDIRPIHRQFNDPCRNAKIHKILPHEYFPNARYSLWVDGSVLIKSQLLLKAYIEKYLANHDLAVFKHRCRNCVYEEAAHCIACGVDSRGVIERQIMKYRLDGYPANNGLAECTVLLRRHTKKMRAFNEHWHREITAHSRRDQLSFNYIAHKLEFKYFYLPGNMADNPHFSWLAHTAPRSHGSDGHQILQCGSEHRWPHSLTASQVGSAGQSANQK